MYFFFGIVLTGLALAATAKPNNITEFETALLPRYCIDTEWWNGGAKYSNRMSPRAPYWVGVMGEGFWWMHHYCGGLVFLNRAKSSKLSAMEKRYAYQEASMEFKFTIAQLPNTFVLLPEIYVKLGEAKVSLSDIAGANSSYSLARELKPDYWPAYTQWAEVLIKTGKKAEAKALVGEGLRYASDSRVLREQFKSLGGDPGKIQAIAKSPEPSESTEAPSPILQEIN